MVLDVQGEEIDSSFYKIDFVKSEFYILKKEEITADSLLIKYRRYPDFLTKKYFQLDEKIIVQDNKSMNRLYQLSVPNKPKTFVPFEGLNTSGSITRGVTIGNNQNSVLDSELDLQISGKLSEKVGLRASIQDANVPLQEGGYSQNIEEFDQVFIELFSKNWNIRAGDVDLVQEQSYFASFRKKVQGVSLSANLSAEKDYETQAFVSGALVKGVFARSEFLGREGNQGPYKLTGPNGELYVLIVSGSETVYVNGIPLQRGESEDYIIDYNSGEIIFNATFPITSEMRIIVEYQYSERRYNRIIATAGGVFKNEKLEIGTFVYSESDAKNQPLQQNLSSEQVGILQEAGDNPEQMIAPSAVPSEFSQNRTLYRKEIINGTEVFVYSTNPEDELFTVKFSLVGENTGNYVLSNASAIQKIYEYVPPINGVLQGNYEPVTQLYAPTRLQIAMVNGNYNPTEKTEIEFEIAGSKNDENLFSSLGDENNTGFATRIAGKQVFLNLKNSWLLQGKASVDYVQDTYRNVEGLYNVEFERDWNLIFPQGNQILANTGIEVINPEVGNAFYNFQLLEYSENFNGKRHEIFSALNFGKWQTRLNASYMNSESEVLESGFTRINSSVVKDFDAKWIGAKFSMEENIQKETSTEALTGNSQSFKKYEIFTGIGDSTNVFAEVGYRYRVNDSLRNNHLQRVSNSNTFYVESTVLNNEKSNLSVFINYRKLNNLEEDTQDDQSLNSRILYNQSLFNKIVQLNTVYETNSGSLAQQEFTYLEVEPGEGFYTWNDYNNNGIQELEEFETASFQDEADFVRILLPNQIYLSTHQNKLSQILTLNFEQWSAEERTRKFLSHFYNQSSYVIDRKTLRDGNSFNFNPFKSEENELGLNLNFRNTLFFNRGKQDFTTSYSFIFSETKNLLSTGLQENAIRSHQINFNHKVQESWILGFKNEYTGKRNNSENFMNRNYRINQVMVNPEISYLITENSRVKVFYEFQKQKNELANFEKLEQQKAGFSFAFANGEKFSVSGEANYIFNAFEGNPFSPVAYQMLEGLQPEKNFTWNIIAQKKLTDYLNLNFSYFGRKSENSYTIHTGSMELRAYF